MHLSLLSSVRYQKGNTLNWFSMAPEDDHRSENHVRNKAKRSREIKLIGSVL